jgi:hypothetical protein
LRIDKHVKSTTNCTIASMQTVKQETSHTFT